MKKTNHLGHFLLLLSSLLLFISSTYANANIKSSIVVSNKINSTHLLFQTYNLHDESPGPSTYFQIANKTNANMMTFHAPSFYFENPQGFVMEFAAATLNTTRVFALQHQEPGFILSTAAALAFDDNINKLYSLGGNEISIVKTARRNGNGKKKEATVTLDRKKTTKIPELDELEVMVLGNSGNKANEDAFYVFSIDDNTGDVVKEFVVPEKQILIGSFALDTKDQVMYYILGPQDSFALVTQRYDSKNPGKVESIHTLQGDRGGAIATNLFYCNKTGELFATLLFDDDSSAVAWMETPEAGSYRILLDFGKEFHSEESGKVMQRMISYDSHKQVLYGWYASVSGSTSKLFAASVSPREAHILASVDYREQDGNWRGVGFFY